jgi:predicted ferric reductase
MHTIKKAVAPILFLANLVAILYIWWNGSGSGLLGPTVASTMLALGTLCGLLAFYFALWQMLLIGRVGFIERPWGHDKLSRYHHLLGLTAISIMIFHPLFLSYSYSILAETTGIRQLWTFVVSFPDVWRAAIGYLMFLGIILISLTIIRKRLRYEWWYTIHLFLYVAIIFSFGHQLTNGSDILTNKGFAIYWQVLFYGALASLVFYRVYKPLRNFYKQDFRVSSVSMETPDVTNIIISGKDLSDIKAKAGQFVLVRFFTKGRWWDSHPFSLSEVPDGKRFRLSVKGSGDFTKGLPSLPVGTRVIVEGPLGRFTSERATSKNILLIAGGIGITPLRGLFEVFAKQGAVVDLLYAARSDADFALKTELDAIVSQHVNAKAHYLPEPAVGRTSPELIKKEIPDVSSREVFLCGPPPMMKAVRQMLIDLGVPKNKIYFEKFQLG